MAAIQATGRLQQRPSREAARRPAAGRASPARIRAPIAASAAWWQKLVPVAPKGKVGQVGRKDLVELGPLSVSPMGLGTWAWGNKLLWGYDEQMDEELQEVYNLCIRAGVNLFDTADSYGTGALNGQSEKLLGKFMAEYPGQPKFEPVIASKFAAYPWRITRGSMVEAARASAQRLRRPAVDIGQLHWSTANYQPFQERAMWGGLVDMYEAGLVRAVGVSNYGPKQLAKIARFLEQHEVPLVSVQIQYSLLSQTAETAGAAAACADLGLQMIAYSPLALGMLSSRYGESGGKPLPPGPRGAVFRGIVPGLDPLYDTMEAICEERGKTMSQVAINWCMAKGAIPIPGAKNLAQAEANLGALGWALDDGEVAELEAAAARAPKQMVQNIFMTR
eukprot:jgi/Tetstr1/464576/TSEL_009332.t1